jgi:hypothetical protein
MTMRVRIELLALKHCWNILTGSCLTTLLRALISLSLSDYHLSTCQKNWLGSQRFNNDEEIMESVKTYVLTRIFFLIVGFANISPQVTFRIFFLMALQPQLGPRPTSMKLSVFTSVF